MQKKHQSSFRISNMSVKNVSGFLQINACTFYSYDSEVDMYRKSESWFFPWNLGQVTKNKVLKKIQFSM